MDSYKTYSDEQLLELLKSNDESAFDTIYRRYWKRLFVLAAKNVDDFYLAEELVQDIFIKLWERKNNLDIKVPLSAYLSAAVKYKTIDACLKQKNKKSSMLILSLDDNKNDSIDPFMEMLEFESQLTDLISNLPEKCQIVFRLSKKEGYNHKEIANHLSISEKTVEYHITKAIKLLRGGLGNFLFILFIIH